MWTTSIVAFPCDLVEDGHVTVEFLGETADIQASKEDVINMLAGVGPQEPMEVTALGVRLFGMKTGEPVWVLLLDAHDLAPIAQQVEQVLESNGIHNMSSYADSDYKPHLTLKEFDNYTDLEDFKDLPETVTLGPMELWWNEERNAL